MLLFASLLGKAGGEWVGSGSIVSAYLRISSPKRGKHLKSPWETCLPYYAGFPESFVEEILLSAGLKAESRVLDPWNGSGTTTYIADKIGINSTGIDINPAMMIIAKARLANRHQSREAFMLAREIIRNAMAIDGERSSSGDELHAWFDIETTDVIRAIEFSLRSYSSGHNAESLICGQHTDFNVLNALLYVALFNTCRSFISVFRASNPTWLRKAKSYNDLISVNAEEIFRRFEACILEISRVIESRKNSDDALESQTLLICGNSTEYQIDDNSVDFVLTSPPYCTRLDYVAATSVECAILSPVLSINSSDLSRSMLGSVRVPLSTPESSLLWGEKCLNFLSQVKVHPSKASSGYYIKTLTDYFHKLFASLGHISRSMKTGAVAVFVVQDSFYKDLWNDLPGIIIEMGRHFGMVIEHRCNFSIGQTMAGRNRHVKRYRPVASASEAVLCFVKA